VSKPLTCLCNLMTQEFGKSFGSDVQQCDAELQERLLSSS